MADGPFRLLFVQPQAEGAGAQELARLLGEKLAERGFEVHHCFLYRRTGYYDGLPRVHYCAASRPRDAVALLRLLIALLRHLRRVRPHAAVTFQHWGNVIAAPIARVTGVRCVLANRTSATLAMRPVLAALDEVLGVLGFYSRIVVNSGEVAREYDRHPAAYRRRVVRIDHGFRPRTGCLPPDAAREALRARLGLGAEASVLGCVSRLHALKNLPAAVRLLPGDARRHLVLVGQGPEREALVALARELGCDERLHLLGEQPAEAIGDILAGLDLFVFPSLAETFGLAVVEAAAAGVPVLAHDLPVLREVLQVDGEPCGLFADARDERAFGAAATALLCDAAASARLAATGRRLERRYSPDAMAAAYERLLGDCRLG
ncbi:glycosyl transferase (plasmid) [Chelatococcus daeguensis]|uniref:Glycosyl transferase n=1 Tax=Chelatococcus daeguensis TaxID=444444 RepID=A0AAC9P0D6_9HYPH|nr:glycosyltransferase family 4 protein [Chelatococcus daeguensis]APF39427.1 glycosyl transferase [Chelatococcus daeguensis]